MLDYRFIKENIDAVKQNIKNRNMTSDADLVVELFNKRTQLISALQEFQQKRNENAAAMKQKLEVEQRNALIEEGKALKEKISLMEAELKEAEEALDREGKKIPNMAHPDAPIGSLDTENLEVKQVGKPRNLALYQRIMWNSDKISTSSILRLRQRFRAKVLLSKK